jgi:hypothetical protein
MEKALKRGSKGRHVTEESKPSKSRVQDTLQNEQSLEEGVTRISPLGFLSLYRKTSKYYTVTGSNYRTLL